MNSPSELGMPAGSMDYALENPSNKRTANFSLEPAAKRQRKDHPALYQELWQQVLALALEPYAASLGMVLSAFSLVCRSWKILCGNLKVELLNQDVQLQTIFHVPDKSKTMPTVVVDFLEERGLQLQSLNFECCPGITDIAMKKLLPLTHLKSLNLASTLITGASLQILAPLMQLQKLNLRSVQSITDVDLTLIATQFKELQYLNLIRFAHEVRNFTPVGLKALATLPKLQSLCLAGCGCVTDAGLRALASLTQLTHLNVKRCHNITNAGLSAIALLSQLQKLELTMVSRVFRGGGSQLTQGGINAITWPPQLQIHKS